MAKILKGKILAEKIKSSIREEVKDLQQQYGRVPRIVNILIGTDPGSCAYAKSQKRTARDVGLDYDLLELPQDVSQRELISRIKDLGGDDSVDGIMLHKPFPSHVDYSIVANYVPISKDLEGINVTNIGKMVLNETKLIPCTPAAVMEHIKSTNVDLKGKEAVIIGHSHIVGKPLCLLLLKELATVTVCHIGTSQAGHLTDHIQRAEILVVAVGRPELVKGQWIKEGAVVIDVGINNVNGKIVGDVEFESAKNKAAFITPVPGGVGPVTVIMLMRNALEAFKSQRISTI